MSKIPWTWPSLSIFTYKCITTLGKEFRTKILRGIWEIHYKKMTQKNAHSTQAHKGVKTSNNFEILSKNPKEPNNSSQEENHKQMLIESEHA